MRSDGFYDFIVRCVRMLSWCVARIEIEGLERIPQEGGVILVSNHISYADPLLLGGAITRRRRVRALAKESLFRAPIVGWILRKMGHVPVHRGTDKASEALASAIDELNDGGAIFIYPEGTVPRNGEWLGNFKTGAARLALATGAPVIPIAQIGAEQVLPARKDQHPIKTLLRAFIHRPTVRIVVGEPFRPLALPGMPPQPENREQAQAVGQELRLSLVSLLKTIKEGGPAYPEKAA